MTQKPLLEVKGLTINFGKPVVKGVSFAVQAGEIVGLVGESGCGKSVTAHAILQLLSSQAAISSGEICYLGDNLLNKSHKEIQAIRGKEIAMIPQDPMTALNPIMTIGEQLTEGLKYHKKLSRAEALAAVIPLLEKMGIDDPEMRLRQYPHEFSGGMKQRILIAIAMACRPALLIADEPTTALDVTIQAQILDLLKAQLQGTGIGMLFITHDLAVVAQLCDRLLVMHDGEIVEEGSVKGVFSSPKHKYTEELLTSSRRKFDRKGTQEPVSAMKPLLELKNISKEYSVQGKRLMALSDVSLEIYPGEALGLAGESGSGKSTIGKVIVKLVDPTAGALILDGQEITRFSRRAMQPLRRDVQMVFQSPFSSLDPKMTIREILKEALDIHGLALGEERGKKVAQLMEWVHLPLSCLERFPSELSGGQRQRVGIARALAVNPRLLVCDEPLSSLDVTTQWQILKVLKDLQQRLGLAYLFISHDLSVLRSFADRIAIIHHGKIVEMGAAEELYSHPSHPYTQRLIRAIPVL